MADEIRESHRADIHQILGYSALFDAPKLRRRSRTRSDVAHGKVCSSAALTASRLIFTAVHDTSA